MPADPYVLPAAPGKVISTEAASRILAQHVGDYAKAQIDVNALIGAILGTGIDGALIFDGTSTVAGLTPSSGVYTMTRDIDATTLAVTGTTTVITAGYRIRARGLVTIGSTATIHNNGGNASGVTAGAAALGGSFAPGSIGGTGGTGTGGAAGALSSTAGSISTGALGGSSTNPRGSAGTTSVAIPVQYLRSVFPLLNGSSVIGGGLRVIGGGPGGSAGGGDNTNNSGAGGGGGGVVAIYALGIANAGTISAKGGNGANAAGGNSAGGAGGAGGIVALYTLQAVTGGGTVTVAGGSAGTSSGTGTAAAAGSTGIQTSVVVS